MSCPLSLEQSNAVSVFMMHEHSTDAYSVTMTCLHFVVVFYYFKYSYKADLCVVHPDIVSIFSFKNSTISEDFESVIREKCYR